MRQAFCLTLLLITTCSFAGSQRPPHSLDAPHIAIIIDDLGDRLHDGKRVIELRGEVTVGILPYTPFARQLAQLANIHRKEIMLHLPMESVEEKYLGRGGLQSDMDESRFIEALHATLDAVPNIRGVNNHMGSRLTQDATRMGWLMAGLQRHGELYFVDSRTTSQSQADHVAVEYGLEHASRDVFLDHDKDPTLIHKQWDYLLQLARQKGSAVAIGHPYPETIQFLQQALPRLAKAGVELIPVSELIEWRKTRRSLAWQTQPSSSPLPRAAKNSKP